MATGSAFPRGCGRRARARRPGSACRCRRRRAPGRARSRGASSLSETPGMPGSQRSSEPWRTSRRLPASGERSSRSGIHGARPSTRSTPGWSAAADRDRAAHREAEQQRARRAGRLDRGPRVLDAEVEPLPRLDPVAHLAEAELREPRREPLDEPFERGAPGAGDLAPWPPFTHTTVALIARVRDSEAGTGRELRSPRSRLSLRCRTSGSRRPRATLVLGAPGLGLVRIRGVAGSQVGEGHRDRHGAASARRGRARGRPGRRRRAPPGRGAGSCPTRRSRRSGGTTAA